MAGCCRLWPLVLSCWKRWPLVDGVVQRNRAEVTTSQRCYYSWATITGQPANNKQHCVSYVTHSDIGLYEGFIELVKLLLCAQHYLRTTHYGLIMQNSFSDCIFLAIAYKTDRRRRRRRRITYAAHATYAALCGEAIVERVVSVRPTIINQMMARWRIVPQIMSLLTRSSYLRKTSCLSNTHTNKSSASKSKHCRNLAPSTTVVVSGSCCRRRRRRR